MFSVSSRSKQSEACQAVRDTLLSMLEGEMPDIAQQPQVSKDIAAHLAVCSSCTAYREQLRDALSMLEDAARADDGFDQLPSAQAISDGIMAHVLRETQSGADVDPQIHRRGANVVPLRKNLWRWGSLVAAVTLLVLAFPLLKGYMAPEEQPSIDRQMAQTVDETLTDTTTLAYIKRTEAAFDTLSGVSAADETTRYADPIEDLVGF